MDCIPQTTENMEVAGVMSLVSEDSVYSKRRHNVQKNNIILVSATYSGIGRDKISVLGDAMTIQRNESIDRYYIATPHEDDGDDVTKSLKHALEAAVEDTPSGAQLTQINLKYVSGIYV